MVKCKVCGIGMENVPVPICSQKCWMSQLDGIIDSLPKEVIGTKVKYINADKLKEKLKLTE